MYQDNLSAMLFKNNEILSRGNRTKIIPVRYFLIKNRILMGGLKVKYFLTGEILADHFTKTLQGTALRKFRAYNQGIKDETPDTNSFWYRPKNMFIPSPQECVVIMLTSKHVLGVYTFTNVSKHVFKMRMCLLRT